MKFFWKIFFTTMFVSVICVTLSGYILITSTFRSQLTGEVNTALEYSKIVFYSLSNQFENTVSESLAERYAESGSIDELVAYVANSIVIGEGEQKIAFNVIDTEQNVIFSSLDVTLDKSVLTSSDGISFGGKVHRTENGAYVQIMRPAVYRDKLFYIETVRDVTDIFENHRAQYRLMIEIVFGMIIFGGLLTFIVSKLLLRRIVMLTKTTKLISDGNLSERVPVDGQDELALLSENFNYMADSLEEKIRELKDEAKRKEDFVAAFSHELKTPLTSIIGYSDLMSRSDLSEEERHICANYIFSEGKRLETLSLRLLDLIVLKNHTLMPKPVNIKFLLDNVAELLSPQLTASGIELVCDVQKAVIPMEAELMETVFINLLDNSRKAVEGSGKIVLNGQMRGDEYVVTITDSGKGMEAKELSKITEAFYMVDKSRSRKQGGVGLGLAICKEILLLHGFDISFDSTVNVGTTVTIIMGGQKNENL